ncbi:MAG: PAS domain S-box protein, partial [Thermodesulfobacteriota bacterium]
MNLRTQIFLVAFALGLLPLLTLIGFNLSGHIKRHEEVGLQQAAALQQLSFSKINSRIDHYRQTLEAISKLPRLGKIVGSSSAKPSKELLVLLNSWLSERDAILEVTFFDLEDKPRLSLIRNDLFFEVNQETTITPDSNKVINIKELILSTSVIAGQNQVNASFRIDTGKFLAEHLDSFWISPTGNYLRQPLAIKLTTNPDTNAFEDFPDLQALLSFRRTSLWESESGFTVTWMPILLDGLRPALWVGSPVDRTAAIKWKQSLIGNIITIVLLMSVIIFFIANGIAKKIDSIKERILTGLDRVLNNSQEFEFKWSGPKEITTMAEDLSRLAQQYIGTNKARYAAESALRENQDNFNNLTNSAQDAIVLMDHHGDISYWNDTAEEMFGYSREEAIGKPIHSLISPRMVEDKKPKPIKERSSGEGPIRETIELISKKKSGSDLPVELSLSEARIKDKWHSIWIIRDISERKWAEEKSHLQQQQLVQADKMVSPGLLVSGVA